MFFAFLFISFHLVYSFLLSGPGGNTVVAFHIALGPGSEDPEVHLMIWLGGMEGSCTRVSADGCPLIITGSGAG
jgi:hypothetical protein